MSTSLEYRARALKAVRSFFDERGVLEVDTPLLLPFAPIDPFIEILRVDDTGFLHSSPEYAMKLLLAKEAKDIYQLSHVFRKGETGRRHRVEFTMCEWYRLGQSLSFLIEETLEMLRLVIPCLDVVYLTYEEAFAKTTGVSLEKANMHAILLEAGIHPPSCRLSDVVWSEVVEKRLPHDAFVVITKFPEESAALAKRSDGAAERFEIYYGGHELANGYDELCDAKQMRARLEEHARLREVPLPFPEAFFSELGEGFPECVGVAVGFDRMLMAGAKASDIADILPPVLH